MEIVHGDSDTRPARRGALVVVEGLDRAGKSTQCAALLQSLQDLGVKAKSIRFPDRTTLTGQTIDKYLRGDIHLDDQAVHLLFSANRWEAAAQIREDIALGTTVIVDRYSYSGAVYSAAKEKEDLTLEWAYQPEIGLPRPDIWFFLNVSSETAERRGGYGAERYETAIFQEKVGKLFLSLEGISNNEEMRIIDANSGKDEISRYILDQVLRCIANVEVGQPLRKLDKLSFESAVTS